jgi:integrase
MSKDENHLDLLDTLAPEAIDEQAAASRPLAHPDLVTAEDLLHWVRNDECSAIQWLGRVDDTPLSAIGLADVRFLVDDRIRKIRANKGLTKIRRSNIVTLLNGVLVRAGILAVGTRRRGTVTHQWGLLLRQLPCQDDRNTFGSFARFCSGRSIEPADVTLAVWEAYVDETLHQSTLKKPRKTLQKVLRVSNAARTAVSGWPLPEFPGFENPRTYSIDRALLPASFWADVDNYIKVSSTRPKNIFDKNAARQLRPDTLVRYREVLWRTASAQVHAGRLAAEIVDLAALIDVPWLESAMNWLSEHSGGKFIKDHLNTAATWLSVAKSYLRQPATVTKALREDIFDKIKNELGSIGFSEKNMRKLDQFSDPETVRRFLFLPFKILQSTRKKQQLTPDDVAEMTAAVAIELLLATMIRRKNLTSLDLSTHFWPAAPTKGGKWAISFVPDEVKNDQPLRFPLGKETITLMQFYLKKCRPLVMKAQTGILFLRPDGKPYKREQLAGLVSRTIRRHLDLDVNVHLFRHIGTMLYLDTHPGDFGVPQAMLGHTSDLTTRKFYARLEATKAIQHFTAAVLGERNGRISKLRIM